MWRRDAEPTGAIDSARAIGPTGWISSRSHSSRSSRRERVIELLAALHPAARQQPVVAAVLRVAHQEHLRPAVQEGRDA